MKNLKFVFLFFSIFLLIGVVGCDGIFPDDEPKTETNTETTGCNCINYEVCENDVCKCPEGYSGSDCEIDDCANLACLNGGDCVNGSCVCSNAYTGVNCEIPIDPCAGVSCVNGDLDSDCDCNCNDGWMGNDCSTPEPELYTFIPDPIYDICPVHIGGDKEFSGNGPKVIIRCEAKILNETSIYVKVYFHVEETKSDWTEGLFEGDIMIDVDIPNGKKINRITSSTRSHANYIDTDNHFDYPNITHGSLVQSFKAKGDTGGNDLGQCINDSDAELNIYFNQMTIELVDE